MRPALLCGGMLLTAAVLALTARSGSAAWQQEQLIQNDLKIVVVAYHLHGEDRRKPPEKAEDLAPYLSIDDKDKRLLEALKSGKIQFQYGVPVADIVKTTGLVRTVLAYEKDAPTRGGYVAFANGDVRKVTAEEFKKTALARKN